MDNSTLCLGIISGTCIIIAAIIKYKKFNGNDKDIINLLKNELLDVLRELVRVNTTNGVEIKHVSSEVAKIHTNTLAWNIHSGEMIKDFELMERSFSEKLADNNKTLNALHQRLDKALSR